MRLAIASDRAIDQFLSLRRAIAQFGLQLLEHLRSGKLAIDQEPQNLRLSDLELARQTGHAAGLIECRAER